MIIIVFERAARCYDGEPKPKRQKLGTPIYPALFVLSFNMGVERGQGGSHDWQTDILHLD